jgi:hypothetical protein
MCKYCVLRCCTDDEVTAGVRLLALHIHSAPLTLVFSKSTLADEAVMDILAELTKIPAAAKYWKTIVSEALNDNRFFNTSPEASVKWKPLIKALVETDRQTVTDLLGALEQLPWHTITYRFISCSENDSGSIN